MNEFENGLDQKFKFDFSAPCKSEIDVKKLAEFLERDEAPVLIFYGGEPLLEIDKIVEIIENVPAKVKFRMQTNGKLLYKLPVKYLNKIEKILISLDGNKERTDHNRGDGTYTSVMENIKFLDDNNYSGELIARMTIDQKFPDVYEQVKNLVEYASFKSIHWQVDAGFYRFDFDENKIKKFFQEYNASISKLVDYWIREMKQGVFLRLYPFVAIAHSILNDEKTLLRCGAGHSGYAITTDGKVIACPIMNGIKNFEAGNLDSKPEELKKFSVGGRCETCLVRDLCGGRCLYWRNAELWPKEGDDMICESVKHLINEVGNRIPEINSMIEKKIISKSDFDYEKYFGPEIIP